DYLNNISIGAIAQDPNNLGTIYVGTGEGYPNADAITGTGMFKTTDDGETWDWVASTQTPAFANIYEVYVHTNGDIYVCTQNGGILRSKDGAQTWEKVLGSGLSGSFSNTFYDFKYIPANQTFFASNDNSIFKSTTGDRGDWANIGTTQPGFPNDLQRVEFDVCPTSPEVIYCVGNINSLSSNVFESQDGGATWQTRAIPPIMSDNYGQGWYDLDIAVDPFNCLHIIAGGIGLAESFNQGLTWQPLFGIHSDEHNITFDPTDIGRILFGCDGGFWMSENNGQTIVDKSINYVTTQFYGCAIHPAAASPYIMGGAQDNGTHAIKDPGLSPSDHVTGADGMLCFIDQADPNFQISSSQNGGWNLSTDGGNNFSGGLVSVNGDWVDWS
ncbi:MAG TPA: hypothetical protein VJ508_18680, partial [Saprospiraceae bacterium]|nr:hypothetical protein [Saprospiraceae bacterium]